MKPKSAKAIFAAFLLALALLSGVAAISYRSTERLTSDNLLVEHTHDVIATIEKLVNLVISDAVSHRGFLITGEETLLTKHQKTIVERDAALDQLRVLLKPHPSQTKRFESLADVIMQREALARNHVELRRDGGFPAVQAAVATGRGERMLDRMNAIATEMCDYQQSLLVERLKRGSDAAKATRWAIVSVNLVAFSLVGGALCWLAWELMERERGDAALRKSEKRFRALVTASSDSVYQMTPEWDELLQLESRDFLAPSKKGNADWLDDYIYKDDQELVMSAIRSSVQSRSMFELEHRILLVDGSVGWIATRSVPILNAEGKITEWFGTASNITERKKTERALQENEELLRFALATEQTGLWRVDMESNSTVRSQRHDEIFGYSEPLEKWNFEDFTGHIVEESRDQIVALIMAGIADGRGWDFECKINRHDGAVRWIRVASRALRHDPGSAATKFAGIVRDITDQKQADERARENEQFKASVLDAIPAEIALLDREGMILAVNESWTRFGEENGTPGLRSAGKGDNYLEVTWDSAQTGDLLAAEAFVGISGVLAHERLEFYQEYPCDSPTRKRWFLMHAVIAPGESGGAIIAHTDITARKQAEQALAARTAELETIMLEVPIAIFIGHGSDSSFITANPAARKMLRVGDEVNVAVDSPEMRYQLMRDGKVLLPMELPMQRAASTGQPIFESELEIIYPDGDRRKTLGNAVPLFDDSGKITGSIGTFIDITERKAAEESLRNFNAKLTEAVVERTTELRSTVRNLEREIAARQRLEGEILELSEREQTRLGQDLHDNLGQQLAGIAMLSQALARDLQKAEHPSATDANQIARCLSESIQTTRNLAKSFYPVELERGDLILALQDLAQRTKLLSKVDCMVTADFPVHFEKATEIHLYRIVQESINNALKHGKATEVHIDCSSGSTRWTLTVASNGADFVPPDDHQDVGMGLHIFQYRAALIGAEITVARGHHGGCSVKCTLPLPVVEA